MVASGEPSAVAVRDVAWDHPDAVRLRRWMYDELAAVYPAETAAVEERGGFAWLERARAGTWSDVLVAYAGHTALGHVGSRPAGLPDRLDGTVAEVRALVVVPPARRLGVATALIDGLAARSTRRGVRTLVLETGARQPAALALYARLGFRPIGAFDPHPPDEASWFGALDL